MNIVIGAIIIITTLTGQAIQGEVISLTGDLYEYTECQIRKENGHIVIVNMDFIGSVEVLKEGVFESTYGESVFTVKEPSDSFHISDQLKGEVCQ